MKKELEKAEQMLRDYERLADVINPNLIDYRRQIKILKDRIKKLKKQIK